MNHIIDSTQYLNWSSFKIKMAKTNPTKSVKMQLTTAGPALRSAVEALIDHDLN